ncbi:acyl-CoA N-acyltransferase [Trichoderma citrinoviride]|uniref:Acyl-CoA N-acyltransferase n=1 Tax=Trichoderma citrinoviride TaxID=58853 RepID=A0A2T4B1P9_9HYPO|nr:acyl-CoA N-acyltransferase [Trichoderma citrinoviride]PTB63247.1 acyl-CoA N-acyltransferase [Trichoderma citrinoviride]
MAQCVLRYARYSELPEIAHVMAKAFWDDNLFGDLIHPHRNEYPDDVDLYWLRRARVSFWNSRCRFIVAVAKDETGHETIAGIAQWARLGDGGKKLESWYMAPRDLLKPLSSLIMTVHAWLWPNRASDPITEDIVERAYPYFSSLWTDQRAESWFLDVLAVRPDCQGKGVGRKLVQWGLDNAEGDGICASVISAFGKEKFYCKCGFNEQYGSAMQGDGNPLAGIKGGNIYWKGISKEI